MQDSIFRFMLLTHRQSRDLGLYLAFIEQCVLGGVSIVQLREKNEPYTVVLRFTEQIKLLLDKYQIPLIINDNVDLAIEVDAHGVHLGQTDGSLSQARYRLGPNKLIGVSLESEKDLYHCNKAAIDYAAASAVYPTNSKTNLRTYWGLAGVQWLKQHSNHPLIAIGGINLANVSAVMSAGASGVAVIAALHDSEEPQKTALMMRSMIDRSFR